MMNNDTAAASRMNAESVLFDVVVEAYKRCDYRIAWLAHGWPALASALAELMLEHGYRPPMPWHELYRRETEIVEHDISSPAQLDAGPMRRRSAKPP